MTPQINYYGHVYFVDVVFLDGSESSYIVKNASLDAFVTLFFEHPEKPAKSMVISDFKVVSTSFKHPVQFYKKL